jgi:hypothetical protein
VGVELPVQAVRVPERKVRKSHGSRQIYPCGETRPLDQSWSTLARIMTLTVLSNLPVLVLIGSGTFILWQAENRHFLYLSWTALNTV